MIVSDRVIDELFDELERFDLVGLRRRAHRLNRRDRTGSTVPDGHKARTISGDIPANDPEALTPVEAATETRVFGELERDRVHEANENAVGFLYQAASSLAAMVNQFVAADEYQTVSKPVGQTSTPCKCDPSGCDQPAVKRGLCLACYQWTYRWEQEHPGNVAPLVPASVIAERTKRREKAS